MVPIYHVRDRERALDSQEEIMGILARGRFMTVAMCKDGHPYLVSVNYSFDRDAMRLYFHCAREGRKLEIIESNPEVWGQVLEDLGYLSGRCDYGYRTVMFWGKAGLVEDMGEKRKALEMMINRLEPNADALRKRLIKDSRLGEVTVVRIALDGMTGKQNLP